jgi:hypothetical protein
MSREKKSQVDDVTKLRKILDNPSDPALKALISKDEVVLESVRRRLAGDTVITRSHSDNFLLSYNSLEPRVTVHPQVLPRPRMVTSLSPYKPSVPLPEFSFVSFSEPMISTPVQELSFTGEELFEVEKVDNITPEFLEVTTTESQLSLDETTTIGNEQTQTDDSELPEWQPIQEIQSTEKPISDEKPMDEFIEEFEQPDSIMSSENGNKTIDDTAIPSSEVSIEPPIEFLPIEPQEPQFAQFSKREIREAKKAQKKKDKEAKRQKKLEQKKIKIEQRENEQEAHRLISEQSSMEPPKIDRVSSDGEIQYLETPQSTVDYNTFDGITCIDDKTAEILYRNGYFSVDNLRDATIDDLGKIHGIKRTLAKQIKKEMEQKINITDDSEFVPSKNKKTKKKSTTESDDTSEWESFPIRRQEKKQSSLTAYTYEGYTLYKRKTGEHHGKNTTIHFFSKEKPSKGQITKLPDGYKVAVNRKTGIPYLKKK